MTARDHGSSLDTLRWGDLETIQVSSSGEVLSQFTKQLVQAHWRWPLTWTLNLSFVADFGTTPTETVDFLFDVEYTLGCGQARMTYTETFTMTAASGFADVPVQRFLAAQDIQLRVRVRSARATTGPVGESVQVGATIAPQTEPHAMTEMLAAMQGQPQDQVEWMGPGFHPQPLHYRR